MNMSGRLTTYTLLTLALTTFAALQAALCQSTPVPGLDSGNTKKTMAPGEGSAAAQKMAIMPLLAAGDLLKVSVFGAPDSDQEVRVDADGNIALNFIGSVHVAGLTTEQAQTIIAQKLGAGGFFNEPQVSVVAKEYATQGVSVLGEVQKPNVYPLMGSRRLYDVISLAGGTTAKAGQAVTITHRAHPNELHTVLLSNDPARSTESNIEIFPGDTVVVSKAGIVYIVGDVHKPSGVVMDKDTPMTVMQAIAMAEGTNPTAALNSAKLIRMTPSGPQETRLELKKILAAKAPDIHVQAEDIIFVPSSAAKGAGKRGLEAIIQAATGLAMYHPY
jgi:polysaccharide export outer membrane protein